MERKKKEEKGRRWRGKEGGKKCEEGKRVEAGERSKRAGRKRKNIRREERKGGEEEKEGRSAIWQAASDCFLPQEEGRAFLGGVAALLRHHAAPSPRPRPRVPAL